MLSVLAKLLNMRIIFPLNLDLPWHDFFFLNPDLLYLYDHLYDLYLYDILIGMGVSASVCGNTSCVCV